MQKNKYQKQKRKYKIQKKIKRRQIKEFQMYKKNKNKKN